MKTIGMFTAPILFGFLSACASAPREMVFQAPVVSMTKSNTGNIESLTEGEPVTSKWCLNDAPIVKTTDGSLDYGLVDQALHAAHQKTKADYFVNARAYIQNIGGLFTPHTICAYIEANVGNSGSTGAAHDDSPTPSATKKVKKSVKPPKA